MTRTEAFSTASVECSRNVGEDKDILSQILDKELNLKSPAEICQEIINEISENKGISYAKIAIDSEIPESSIYKITSGRRVEVSLKYAVVLATLYPRCTESNAANCAILAIHLVNLMRFDTRTKVGSVTIAKVIRSAFDKSVLGDEIYNAKKRVQYIKKVLKW